MCQCQPGGGLDRQAVHPQLRDAGGGEGPGLLIPGREQDGYAFGVQPAGRERQGVGRLLVEPLCVIHEAQYAAVAGDLGEQRRYACADEEPVAHRRRGCVSKSDRDPSGTRQA